jgi:hypothetical protein
VNVGHGCPYLIQINKQTNNKGDYMKVVTIKWNTKSNRYSADLGDGFVTFINNNSAMHFFSYQLGMNNDHITDMNEVLLNDGEYIVEVAS